MNQREQMELARTLLGKTDKDPPRLDGIVPTFLQAGYRRELAAREAGSDGPMLPELEAALLWAAVRDESEEVQAAARTTLFERVPRLAPTVLAVVALEKDPFDRELAIDLVNDLQDEERAAILAPVLLSLFSRESDPHLLDRLNGIKHRFGVEG